MTRLRPGRQSPSRPDGHRFAHRGAVGFVFVALVLLLTAAPASAHGGPASSEPPASNWRTRITDFPSPTPGLSITAIDGGEKLELTNQSAQTATVFGYENEPYLRIGPDGVFENRRSPATYLNASTSGTATVPDSADAKADPDWQRISSSPIYSWHDHRAHWMGVEPPPAVQQDPTIERVVIERWSIPIEVDGRRVEATGDLTWIPAPPAWPWLVAILALTAMLAAAGFSRRWRPAVVTAVLVVAGSSAIDIAGTWWASTDPPVQRVASLVTPLLAFGFLAAGLWLLDRRRDDGLLLIFGGAAGVAVFFGWASRGFLTNSQIPSALPAPLARLCVTLALGVGLGLMLLVVILNRANLFSLTPKRTRPAIGNLAARRRGARTPSGSTESRRRMVVFGASAVGGILVIVAVALAAGRSPSESAAPLGSTAAPIDVGSGLCAAISAAAGGDTNGARRAFEAIHTELHTMAQDETNRDRSRAARLLEAKQRVETDLAATPTSLESDLRSLHTITSNITPPASDAARC